MLPRRLESALPWLAACVLLAGAAQQAAVGLGWLEIGRLPGEPAPGQIFLSAALLTLLALVPALALAAATDRRVCGIPAPALASSAFLVAHFTSYDPYYAPTLRRMSDGGMISGGWIVFVLTCALAAAACATHRNRLGTAVFAAACWLTFATAFAASLGH
jgi:hypothetical protein